MSESNRRSSLDLLEIAVRHGWLSVSQADKLANESRGREVNELEVAFRQGFLDSIQIGILETLRAPFDMIPGYELLDFLGQGGMGTVYRARQVNLNRQVAIKTIGTIRANDSAMVSRFEQEAQVVAKLNHPHIVSAYDFGQSQGRLFFAMEFIDGVDAETLVQQRGPLTEFATWALIRQAASALGHAANQGVVHRDIKPSNMLLLVAPEGYWLPAEIPMLKLADFGLAMLAGDEFRKRLTSNHAAIGSPCYMAPEQLQGEAVDLRADIYSLGISAWQMLAGRPPLEGKTLAQLFRAKTSGELGSLRQTVPGLSDLSYDLISTMCQPDPAARLSNYSDVLERIDAVLAQIPGVDLTASRSHVGIRAENENPNRTRPVERFSRVIHRFREIHSGEMPVDTSHPSNAVTAPLQLDAMSVTTESTSIVPEVRARIAAQRPIKRWRHGMQVLAGASVVLLVVMFASIRFGWLLSGSRPVRLLVPSGNTIPLFDGVQLNGTRIRSGEWSVGTNDEGAAVLRGKRGTIAFPFERARFANSANPYFQFECVFEFKGASSIALQFDLEHGGPRGDQEDKLCAVVEPNRVWIGRQSGSRETVTELMSIPVTTPLNQQLHALRFERQLDSWLVFCDGERIGAIPPLYSHPAREVRLAVTGELAEFGDLQITELQ